jgi:hypothetical protein
LVSEEVPDARQSVRLSPCGLTDATVPSYQSEVCKDAEDYVMVCTIVSFAPPFFFVGLDHPSSASTMAFSTMAIFIFTMLSSPGIYSQSIPSGLADFSVLSTVHLCG